LHRPNEFHPNPRIEPSTAELRDIDFSSHSVANLLPVLGLATSIISEVEYVLVDQISTIHLNPQLSYYYFHDFLNTNARHVAILLLISILTFYLYGLQATVHTGLPNFIRIGPRVAELTS